MSPEFVLEDINSFPESDVIANKIAEDSQDALSHQYWQRGSGESYEH